MQTNALIDNKIFFVGIKKASSSRNGLIFFFWSTLIVIVPRWEQIFWRADLPTESYRHKNQLSASKGVGPTLGGLKGQRIHSIDEADSYEYQKLISSVQKCAIIAFLIIVLKVAWSDFVKDKFRKFSRF